MAITISGIGVSRGVVIGKAHVLERGQPEVVESTVPEQQRDAEVERFYRALDTAARELRQIRDRIPSGTSADIRAFIDTYLLMLEDSTFTTGPVELIRREHFSAEWALKIQRDHLTDAFDAMDDPYIRTRKDDVVHVVDRVLRILLNHRPDLQGSEDALAGAIVVVDDLTPADAVLLQHQGVAGFVTERGGPLSHTAIMARSLRIPAVVGAHRARLYLHNAERIILDGNEGSVLASIDPVIIDQYRARQRAQERHAHELDKLRGSPAITKDGVHIQLLANIELPSDVEAVSQVDADGVGLYRTEFLFMNRPTPPDEEEQLENYVNVARALAGLPLTIRTLDLGVDKARDGDHSSIAPNPALGLRAIRLCLREPALFKPQLRAILRASAYGPIQLMIPMLSSPQELHLALELIHSVKRELDQEGVGYDPGMPIGGMIEVPAAAVAANIFAKELDFLSIGTNDLIQYTLAIDRTDDEVSYLYDPLHPAVLQLIYTTIRASKRAGIPVSMCGEMAADCRYTRLLLGLGLRVFSTHPASLLEVKRVITESRVGNLAKPAERIRRSSLPEQARGLLERINARL